MRRVLAALWPYMRHRRWLVVLAAAAMVAEVATALASPWPMKLLFDQVLFRRGPEGKLKLRTELNASSRHALYVIVALVVLIAIADALFTWLDTALSERLSQRAVYALRSEVFAHLQRLSIAFHGHVETRVGDLVSRLSGDIGALQDLAAGGVSNVVTNGLMLMLTAGLMLYLDPILAALAFVGLVPMAITTRLTTTRMREALRSARRQEGRVSSFLQESLSSIRLVQAYGRERLESAKLEDANQLSLQANIRAVGLMARLAPAMTVLSALTTAGLMLVGVQQVLARRISPGELLLFVSYLRAMQSPIRQLAKLGYSVSKATAGLERIQEILSRGPEVADRPGARPLQRAVGDVAFQGVVFGYGPDRRILRGADLTVRAGTTVAVVGPTGAGKTTLVSLLPRFYDVQDGQVLLDGIDVRDLTLESLRAQIAVVLQDSLIFRMSIWDNIAYGRPDASPGDIRDAATAAGVDRIVDRLDDGYATVVSERGSSLSGGEKQCISIARALLKDAPVVILDEPTSAMDSATEHLVMRGLDRLLAGRTVLVIAHRLSTVLKADAVAVLDRGLVVEVGAPQSLLDRPDSRFHQMARRQRLLGPAHAAEATSA
ncbi:MAG: ABC transporter ATP-binding protein [Mycobacteriales bacterium]